MGQFLPMHILFKGPRLMSAHCLNGPKDATYDVSESGWMEGAQFVRWFKLVFLKHCEKLDGFKILFLDGHGSHISLELVRLAMENNIILFRLPAHTSNLLQPLDVGVFRHTKAIWKLLIAAYFLTTGFKNIDKSDFSILMKKLLDGGGFKEEHAQSGFKDSGLFPLCREKVNQDDFNLGMAFREVEDDEASTSIVEASPRAQSSVSATSPSTIAVASPQSSVLATRSPRYSPYSTPPNRKDTLVLNQEKILQSVGNIARDTTNAACLDMTKAALRCLQRQFGTKMKENGPNVVLKYNVGYMMTSPEAVEQLANIEETQAQKVFICF